MFMSEKCVIIQDRMCVYLKRCVRMCYKAAVSCEADKCTSSLT